MRCLRATCRAVCLDCCRTFSPLMMRHDPSRLAELRRRLILDSSRERAYDDLTRLLSSSLEVPIALVNFLDSERDWFKSCIGFPVNESPVSASFCEAFFTTSQDVIVVQDTLQDPRFATHPLVVNAPFVRFYAATRLTSDGHTLGTLCAYDLQPRKISTTQITQMRTLATAAMELISQRPGPPSS